MNKIINQIMLDLIHPGETPTIHAVQGEHNMREVCLTLLCDGNLWQIPEDASLSIRYGRVNLTGGYYDTLPDGSPAWRVEGNKIIIVLAPQMLSSAGLVTAQVEINHGEQRLITFSFKVQVAYNPAFGVLSPETYINWQQWLKKELDAYIEKVKESNELLGGTMAGPINLNGHVLYGLNMPMSNDQAANKEYVDLYVKKAVSRNFLDNSDFRNPVNQRGRTNWMSIGYMVDRWKITENTDCVISLSDDGLTFGMTNDLVVLVQSTTEHLRKSLIGKKVTVVAALSNGENGISSCVVPEFGKGIDSPQISIGGSDLKVNIYCHEGSRNLEIRLLTDHLSSPVTVQNIALYEGEYTVDSLPEYQAKGYGTELQECRRYYREDKIVEVNQCGLSGMRLLQTPFYEPPMRITPTYTINDYNGGMGDLAESSAIINVWGGDHRRIWLSYNGTGVASQCVFTLISNADL